MNGQRAHGSAKGGVGVAFGAGVIFFARAAGNE